MEGGAVMLAPAYCTKAQSPGACPMATIQNAHRLPPEAFPSIDLSQMISPIVFCQFQRPSRCKMSQSYRIL